MRCLISAALCSGIRSSAFPRNTVEKNAQSMWMIADVASPNANEKLPSA